MNKHTHKGTPGTWTYDEVWALVKGPNGEEICAVHSGQGDGARVDRNIAYANAALIAAAPELLAERDRLLEDIANERASREVDAIYADSLRSIIAQLREDNAELVEALTDMVAARNRVVSDRNMESDPFGTCYTATQVAGMWSKAMIKARAALARATGK